MALHLAKQHGRAPEPNVVQLAKDLLRGAKRGEIRALAFSATGVEAAIGSYTWHGWARGGRQHASLLLGEVTRLQFDMAREAEEHRGVAD